MYSFHGISNLDQFLRRNRSGRSFKSNLLEERETPVLILDWKNHYYDFRGNDFSIGLYYS